MKKQLAFYSVIIACLLSGCGAIGTKTASITVIYGVAALLSLLILIGYCCMIHKKDVWYLLLLSSVFIVNIGYFTLSISTGLEEALLANRISYLGSVLLPLAMLMIILNTTKITIQRWIPPILFCISFFVFLVAASPGYLDIYYKEVTLEFINGVAALNKVYGPWHALYLYFLLIYFAVMIAAIIYAAAKKKMGSMLHAVILLMAVFVNIGIWFIEQLVRIDFETLSLSYIISELFLLGLHMIMKENERLKELVENPRKTDITVVPDFTDTTNPVLTATDEAHEEEACSEPVEITYKESETDLFEHFLFGLKELTPTERRIYDYYLDGKTTKEILGLLDIKENTLKFHNKNLYGKLGVSSRKQLEKTHYQMEKLNMF